MKTRITMAQRSALECAGIELEETSRLGLAWDGRQTLVVTPETRDELFDELTAAANGEDAMAEQVPDKEAAKQARAACRSLTALSVRVLRAGRS